MSLEGFNSVFAIFDGQKIQLEERLKVGSDLFGFIIVPGEKVEPGETYEHAMRRGIYEEYGVIAAEYEEIGKVLSTEVGQTNFRHVFLIRKWEGNLSNPEAKNGHVEATLEDAFIFCKHPVSQSILRLVQGALSREDG